MAVYDIGVHEGEVYPVSDYLEGGDLASWMRDNRASWPEATRIAIAVLDALGHAHARRIVHRDVKPANIILTTERMPVLVDFGLALSEEQSVAGERGLLSGTPQYMSPEQAKGNSRCAPPSASSRRPAITAAFKSTSSISWALPSSESRCASRPWPSRATTRTCEVRRSNTWRQCSRPRSSRYWGPRLAVKSTPARKRGDPVTLRAQLLDAAAAIKPARDQAGRPFAGDLDDEG